MRLRASLLGCLAAGALGCHNQDAYVGGGHASYVCLANCWVEQGTPADAGDWFFNQETELGDAPEIVYPLNGSVHPEDLRQLTVQFRRGRADFEVFRLRVDSPDDSTIIYDFFTRCFSIHDSDGCRYLLKGSVWDRARADLRGHAARLTVTGSTALRGVVRSSEPLPFQVVESQLLNKGFYYWANVPQYSGMIKSLTGIYRLPFGADQAEPFIMPNSATNDRQCGACHSVSQDGSTIAFAARDKDDGPAQRSGSLVVKLTAQPDMQIIPPAAPGTYDCSMMALTSTGKKVLVSFDAQLVLRSAEKTAKLAPGDVITTLTKDDLGGKGGYFPEFSPTDDAVVVTLSDDPDSAIAVRSGDIAVIPFDNAKNSFGAPSVVVPGTDQEFHFYPTWSPDGNFIAFATAPRELDEAGNPRKSYDQKKARLQLVARDGGTVYDLKNATPTLDEWSTYPKFAPFQSGSLMFLTFNSKMNYGLVLDNDALDPARIAQLWMSAVDVNKLPDDPSSAPIWLPFQDPSTAGHLGLWTKEVKCRTDSGGTGCDFGQICEPTTNTCVVIPK